MKLHVFNHALDLYDAHVLDLLVGFKLLYGQDLFINLYKNVCKNINKIYIKFYRIFSIFLILLEQNLKRKKERKN